MPLAPRRRLLRHLGDDAVAERDDQATRLGRRDELARRNQTPLGMPESAESLETHAAPVGERHDRLVVQLKQVALKRVLDLGERQHPELIGRRGAPA